jgi:hypothetical protein
MTSYRIAAVAAVSSANAALSALVYMPPLAVGGSSRGDRRVGRGELQRRGRVGTDPRVGGREEL